MSLFVQEEGVRVKVLTPNLTLVQMFICGDPPARHLFLPFPTRNPTVRPYMSEI